MTYTQGFGVSPCQLELLSVELERAVRDVVGGQQQLAERTEGIVKNKERRPDRGPGALSSSASGSIVTAGITAVWLTEEVRVFGLVMLPTAIVAGLLVVYFDWRAKLLSPIRDERNEHRKAA